MCGLFCPFSLSLLHKCSYVGTEKVSILSNRISRKHAKIKANWETIVMNNLYFIVNVIRIHLPYFQFFSLHIHCPPCGLLLLAVGCILAILRFLPSSLSFSICRSCIICFECELATAFVQLFMSMIPFGPIRNMIYK